MRSPCARGEMGEALLWSVEARSGGSKGLVRIGPQEIKKAGAY